MDAIKKAIDELIDSAQELAHKCDDGIACSLGYPVENARARLEKKRENLIQLILGKTKE